MTESYHRLRRIRKTQGGQAIAELGVCIVAIVIVLLGFFLVFILSSDNVKTVIQSREQADENVRKRTQNKGDAQSIHDWDYGGREIPFSADDIPTKSGSSNNSYLNELVANDNYGDDNDDTTQDYGIGGKDGRDVSLNLLTDGGNNTSYLPSDYNAISSTSIIDLFFNAANLTAGTATISDPLEKRNMSNLEQSFKRMFEIDSITVQNTTYMPIPPSVRLPEEMK